MGASRFIPGGRFACAALAAALAIAAGPRAARAQNVDAEALFRQGLALENAGKIGDACEAFAASNRIESRAGTLFQLGECRVKNHQLASAWAAFNDSLTRVTDPAKRRFVEQALKDIEPRLSYLTVSVSDESRVPGLELTRDGEPLDSVMWNRAIPVDGGKIVIGGRAPGYKEWQVTVVVKPEGDSSHVDVPKFTVLPPAPASQPAHAAAGDLHAGAADDDDDDRATAPRPAKTQRYLAYGLGGGGLALGVTAIALELWSRAEISDARARCGSDFSCPDPAYSQTRSLLQGASLRRNLAIATGVLGVASVAAGTYFYLRARHSEHASRTAGLRVTPAADGRTFAVFLDGSF